MRRSRFVTTVAHAPEADVAHTFVEGVRREFPDATHNCWAFVAGPPGSTARVGMSDDGEPHGTAGRPMLGVLLHSGVGEIAVVCTRYYGGVKLGTGGLVRAYTDGVKHVLEGLATAERVDRVRVVVAVGYQDVDALQRLVAERDVTVEGHEYGEGVRYVLGVPSTEREAFHRAVAEITQGRARVDPG